MLTLSYYFLMALTITNTSADAEIVNKFTTKKECENAIHKVTDGRQLVCTHVTIKIKE